jgi:hypothetical protein
LIDLAEIRDVSVFAGYVGSRFRIEIGPDQHADATLVEAEAVDRGSGQVDSAGRAPFSLLFELPENVELTQQTYNVTQKQLGELPLFLVPVGANRMECTFS